MVLEIYLPVYTDSFHLVNNEIILPSQGYEIPKLKTSIKKFYGRHHELVDPYGITMSQLIADVFP